MAGAGVRVKWKGDAVKKTVTKEMNRRLALVGELVSSSVRRSISKPSRIAPSAPGEAPHADTGRLRNSQTYEVDEENSSVRIGSNVVYARALELGYDPNGLEPRPHLVPALERHEEDIRRILTKPMRE